MNTQIPIDTATGLQSGAPVHTQPAEAVEVVVGHLVTGRDGKQALILGDRTRAENYAIGQHAVAIEPAYVRRLG